VSATLFRGGQPTEKGIQTLAQYRVKTIINLRDSDDSREAQLAHDAGMTYIHLPLDAQTVTTADAEKFLTLLASAPAPVFVHCLQGRDRTGMAVAAYRVRLEDWTVKAAVHDLNDHGHFWLLFPQVRRAVAGLARRPGPDFAIVPADVGTAQQN
jgi:tyrosine-protein phosphatase SIW14